MFGNKGKPTNKVKQKKPMFRRLIVLLVLAVLFLVLILPLVSGTTNRFINLFIPVASFSTSTRTVHVVMAGKDLWIPRNYIATPLKHVDSHDVLLEALLPDLQPKTKENINSFIKRIGWQSHVLILVKALSQDKLDSSLQKIFEGKSQSTSTVTYEVVAKKYGLMSYMPTKYSDGHLMLDEVLIEKVDNKILTLLSCSNIDLLPGHLAKSNSPSCAMHFNGEGITFHVSFSRDYLPEWHMIKSGIEQLFVRFGERPSPDARPIEIPPTSTAKE